MPEKRSPEKLNQVNQSHDEPHDENGPDHSEQQNTNGNVTSGDMDTGVLTQVSFKTLGVCDALVDACNQLGWESATRIQEKVLPEALAGRDIIGLAETGSGKTGEHRNDLLC